MTTAPTTTAQTRYSRFDRKRHTSCGPRKPEGERPMRIANDVTELVGSTPLFADLVD
jgi:hypothetical protein